MKESPMLRRMRGTEPQKKKRLPKKGTIRAILLVILVFTVARTITTLPTFFSRPQEQTPDHIPSVGGEVVGIKKVSDKREKTESVTVSATVKKEKPQGPVTIPKIFNPRRDKTLSFEQVSKIVSLETFDVNQPVQKIPQGNDTLIFSLSIDTVLQNLANRLMEQYKPKYGSAVALDPVSGRILALSSFTNQGEADRGPHLFSSSIFPAASIFKIVTAAAALQSGGFTPQTTIPHVGRNNTLYMYQLERELRNYSNISLQTAFDRSINPIFARMALYSLPKGALVDYGHRFGFEKKLPFEFPVEKSKLVPPDTLFSVAATASGFNRTTTLSPVHGALIAAAISEDGHMPVPTVVDSVYSVSRDAGVFRGESKKWLDGVISPLTAKHLRELMISVPVRGTARTSFRYIRQSPRFNEFEYGGKTGNIGRLEIGRTEWFAGFARHPQNSDQRIAVAVVLTHDPEWTVRASFIAAEILRIYMRNVQDQAQELLVAEGESSD